MLAALGVIAACCLWPAAASAALAWHGPLAVDRAGSGPPLEALACPSSGQCVALDQGGGEVSFDPGSPAPALPANVHAASPAALACLSASQCIAVDGAGDEVTFSPAAGAQATSTAIDPGQSLIALACSPDGSVCVALDTAGDAVTFSPAAPGKAQVKKPLQSGELFDAIACPSDTQCLIAGLADNYLTFDPSTQSIIGEATIGGGGSSPPALTAIACPPGGSQCIAFDSQGNEIAIQTSGGSGYEILHLDPGNFIIAADCPSDSRCVALDANGAVVSFTPGQTGTRTALQGAGGINALACSSASSCAVVDGSGQAIAFDPADVGSPTAALIDAVPDYEALDCVSVTQCTAIDAAGDQISFDPADGQGVSATRIDPAIQAISAISCAAAVQCTIADLSGQAITFDPQSGATVPQALSDSSGALLALDCPTTTQCTAADSGGYEITFDPQSAHTLGEASLDLTTGAQPSAISCPLASRCTVLDSLGEVVSFDPLAPGHPTPAALDAGSGVALACPSADECVALSADGAQLTFDPGDPAGAQRRSLGSGEPLGLSCPLTSYCVLIDQAGDAVEFDPHGSGAIARTALALEGAAPSAISCPSSALCVVADSTGAAFAGSQTLPSPPVALAAPRIFGRALQGRTLRASLGVWSSAPTSLQAQWQRCDRRGRDCRPIAGATATRYLLTAADAGDRIRVQVSAANQAGPGRPAQSAPSAIVLPVALGVSGARLARVCTRRPRLTLAISAAKRVGMLWRVSVLLPAGLAVTLRGKARRALRVSVRRGARAPLTRVRGVRRTLTLWLRRRLRTLRLTIAAPALLASRGLAARARARLPQRARLLVSVLTARRRVVRASIELRLGC
jgi:hypothetical protein